MASEATDPEFALEDPEAHRAFVREIHRSVAAPYAWGGGVVVLALVAIVVFGWYRGMLTSPLLWIGAVVVALGGLMVIRAIVYRRLDRIWERVEGYCDTNGVDPEALRDHFGEDPMYQFFDALFELRERRLERADRRVEGEDESEESG